MPLKCCVPKCRGNYDRGGPKVSVFGFPKDEEVRKIWLQRIPRKDFEPTKNSRVCQLHFQPDDLEYKAEIWDSKTGECLSSQLKHPRLKKGSLPCIFEGYPNRTKKYAQRSRWISAEQKRKEKETAAKMAQLRKQKEQERKIEAMEKLNSLDDLEDKLKDFIVKENVRIERRDGKLYIYRLETDPNLQVKYSVEIDESLITEVFLDKAKLPIMKLNSTKLVFPALTPTLSVVQTIVKKLNGMIDQDGGPTTDVKKESVLVLKNILNSFANDSNKDHVHFISQQIDCITRNQSYYRWSSEIITFLGFFMALFPRAYYFLMRSQRITLPSPGIVKELSHEKFAYIPKVKKHAKDDDCSVILVINEVDVRPFSGVFKKKGYSTACVYVFSVSSLITSFKEVVYVTPVQTDYSPSKLHATLLKLIAELEKFKFQVVGLVSDNLPFNVEAVSQLADPPKLSIAYVHPCDEKRPLFYVIDPAHTFKCVRDDWLITPEGIIKFPNFHVPDSDHLLSARYSDLKKLMDPPPDENLKYTHSITKLAMNPVFPHKRDLKLVLQLFSDAVITDLTALAQFESGEISETAQFINIFLNWWKVVGFDSLDKSTYKGLTQPLNLTSEGYEFLETMLDWLEKWGEIIEKERDAVRAELEAQLAEKQAKQAERAAKAVLAELTGAKKRKRKRPKKNVEKDGGTVDEQQKNKEEQGSGDPQEIEVRVAEEPYQPNGNVNWVEQNLNTICGRMGQVPSQAFTVSHNNGYCAQNVYYHHQDQLFSSVHGGYEFNHPSGSNYYPNQAPNQYYQSCAQYGQQSNRTTGGQIMDLDERPPVTVVLSAGNEKSGLVKSEPPELLPLPKKKPRTPKKPTTPQASSTSSSSVPSDPAPEPAPTTASAEKPPVQPKPIVVPRFAGPSRGGARFLRFNYVKYETFIALKHSTYALLEITKYCVNELKMPHILPGKVHVDGLQMICVDSTFTPGAEKDD